MTKLADTSLLIQSIEFKIEPYTSGLGTFLPGLENILLWFVTVHITFTIAEQLSHRNNSDLKQTTYLEISVKSQAV